jgi:hypothetical protein
MMIVGTLEQVVTFDHKQLMDMALEKAKERIKEETGKDPTGSSRIEISHGKENEESINPSTGGKVNYCATVRFLCNGQPRK